MVDRMYKAALPRYRQALERLGAELANLGSGTDWAKLRIEPLLRHVESLEQVLRSREFSGESSRLRRGVEFFRSDLEYLRRNLKGLEKLLPPERRLRGRRGKA